MLPTSSFIICLESGCSIVPASANYILSLANGDFHLPLHCPATRHNLNETHNFKMNRRKILCFNALPSFYLDKATSQPPHQKRGLKILSCIFGHFKAQDTATLSILVMMKKLSTAWHKWEWEKLITAAGLKPWNLNEHQPAGPCQFSFSGPFLLDSWSSRWNCNSKPARTIWQVPHHPQYLQSHQWDYTQQSEDFLNRKAYFFYSSKGMYLMLKPLRISTSTDDPLQRWNQTTAAYLKTINIEEK